MKKDADLRQQEIIETWRGSWYDTYPGERPDGISTTAIEKKNISIWCNEVEAELKSKEAPVVLVKKAFEDWDAFVIEAQAKFFGGNKQGPARPTWWFFRKHWITLEGMNTFDPEKDELGFQPGKSMKF